MDVELLKVFSKLFTSKNISSMITFYAFLILYTIISDLEPNLFLMVIVTLLFWIANSTQIVKENSTGYEHRKE